MCTLSYRIVVAPRLFILGKKSMSLFDPPRLLIFVEWSLYVMNKNRFPYISHHVYLIRHVYQFLEIGKRPHLYHLPRQFDRSEYS